MRVETIAITLQIGSKSRCWALNSERMTAGAGGREERRKLMRGAKEVLRLWTVDATPEAAPLIATISFAKAQTDLPKLQMCPSMLLCAPRLQTGGSQSHCKLSQPVASSQWRSSFRNNVLIPHLSSHKSTRNILSRQATKAKKAGQTVAAAACPPCLVLVFEPFLRQPAARGTAPLCSQCQRCRQ